MNSKFRYVERDEYYIHCILNFILTISIAIIYIFLNLRYLIFILLWITYRFSIFEWVKHVQLYIDWVLYYQCPTKDKLAVKLFRNVIDTLNRHFVSILTSIYHTIFLPWPIHVDIYLTCKNKVFNYDIK